MVFDIGTNNGADAEFYASRGFCVIGVDANPMMVQEASHRLARMRGRIQLFNVGLEELGPGEVDGRRIPFYVTKSKVHSSFELAKVLRYSTKQNLRVIKVPTMRCTELWQHLPRQSTIYHMKVDIEERHHVCIEGLTKLPALQGPLQGLPRYISWENHEHAKGLRFPLLDARLITQMAELGYTEMKVVSNSDRSDADWSSGRLLPEEMFDVVTKSTEWVDPAVVLMRGLGRAVASSKSRVNGPPSLGQTHPLHPYPDWWDFVMRLRVPPARPLADF